MIDIKVWGEYACFTRPEFKVERVSYPIITPGAARGLLEAIYWKPQIRYRVQRIGILNLGTQFTLLRNEITSRQNGGAKGIDYALHMLRDPERHVDNPRKGKTKHVTADEITHEQFLLAEENRVQRTSLVLQNVAYRILARIELCDGESNLAKHLDSVRRRVDRGECHHRPSLGCQEFPADFEAASDPEDEPCPDLHPDVGTMLFDTAYIENRQWYDDHPEDRLEFWRHDCSGTPRIAKGYAKRLFFQAGIAKGWLDVPQDKYDELDRLEDRHGAA